MISASHESLNVKVSQVRPKLITFNPVPSATILLSAKEMVSSDKSETRLISSHSKIVSASATRGVLEYWTCI